MTRMALDVPIVNTQLPSVGQPEPTLAAAPSPIAGNQGTLRSTGHRDAYSDLSPLTPSCRSPKGGSCSGRTPSTCINSVSHVRVRVTSIPVPEAIERLHTERPNNCRCKYSPKESHCATWPNASG